MKKMIIMQGAPGSGKSTKAKEIKEKFLNEGADQVDIFSTDDYFMEDGEYKFNFKKIKEAHRHTQDMVKTLALAGFQVLIIDNTNTQQWEAQPYIDIAKQYNYEVEVIRCDGQYQNTHGVPDDKVEIMRNRLEVIRVD
jgi:predicted kinase